MPNDRANLGMEDLRALVAELRQLCRTQQRGRFCTSPSCASPVSALMAEIVIANASVCVRRRCWASPDLCPQAPPPSWVVGGKLFRSSPGRQPSCPPWT